MRARLPLNPAARQAADDAVRDSTTPPGRRLDPTSPEDAKLRQAWMKAYAAAGGKVEASRSSLPIGGPALPCKHHIELQYLHCDGSPVKGAKYHIRGDGYSADGTLDGNGFVRIDGVPPIGGFDFYFDKDPETYIPRGPTIPSSDPAVQTATSSALEDVGDWLWGTVQGDFNEKATLSQITVNMVLGFIPLVDQALDARDLVAGLKHLIEFYMENEKDQAAHEDSLGLSYEAWLWLGLFLTALGCFPELGSAVKGVAKGLIKKLQDAGKVAGDLSPAELRKIWSELLAILNHLGIDPGNAHEWLKQVPAKLDRWMADAATRIRGAAESMKVMLARAERWASKLSTERSRQALDKIRRAQKALDRILQRLEAMKQRLNAWLKEQFEKIIGGKHSAESKGSIDTTKPNVQKQKEAPPPEPTIPPKPRAERIEELALDPAQGGKATNKTRREAEVGLSLEEQGKLAGPIKRDPTGAAEFVDANGQKWDVKGFNSKYAPKGYNTPDAMSKIKGEIASGENVIVDTAAMSPDHVAELKNALQSEGLMGNVLFF